MMHIDEKSRMHPISCGLFLDGYPSPRYIRSINVSGEYRNRHYVGVAVFTCGSGGVWWFGIEPIRDYHLEEWK